MRLREILEKIKKSELYKLRYNQQVLGYRVKMFNTKTFQYDYYDISIGVKHHKQSFIDSIKDIGYIDIFLVNNIWCSQAEADGKIVSKECKTDSDADMLLSKLEEIYKFSA
jgi:hypothetical protein